MSDLGRGIAAVWSGSELIVWDGGEFGGSAPAQGAAYDPAENTWTRIAAAPLRLSMVSSVWTGEEMIVFGSLVNPGNRARTRHAVGAAYDPSEDAWRTLPPSRLSAQATTAAWTRDRLVAFDYLTHSQEYTPTEDTWTRPANVPFDDAKCYPESVDVGDAVFGFYCGFGALYDPAKGRWRRDRGGPLNDLNRDDGFSAPRWDDALLASGGDFVFAVLLGTGFHGFPTRVSVWTYKPR